MLGLNYLLIAVVEIKPLASKTQCCPASETPRLENSPSSQHPHGSSSVRRPAHDYVSDLLTPHVPPLI